MRNSVICIVSLVLGVCGLAQADLNDGLVAYYPFNGNANDESGNGNDGTVNGATLTLDRNGVAGSAFDFDGDDFIKALDSETLRSGSITLSSWVYSENNNRDVVVISKITDVSPADLGDPNQPASHSYRIRLNGEVPFWEINTNDPWSQLSGSEISRGQWDLLTVTWDGQAQKIYRNGQLDSVNENAADGNIRHLPGADLMIGRGWHPSSDFFDGQIDDVRIYNRALSEEEVRSLYALESKESDLNKGLVAYYPFNGNANDESGNGNDGTVNGATLTLDRNGEVGSAYNFDGNDFVAIPDSTSLEYDAGGSMSISAWVKVSDITSLGVIYSNYRCVDGDLDLSATFPERTLRFTTRDSVGADNETKRLNWAVAENSFDRWLHLTAVRDYESESISFYIDGTVIVTESDARTGGFSIPRSPGQHWIGAKGRCDNRFAPQFHFNGDIDDVRIYNRALNEQEVRALYALESKGNQFQIIEGNFTWQEAKADAEAKGGRLAVLNTQEKIDAANALLRPTGPTVWIGLTDEAQEGQWKWITGEPLTVSNWKQGQPDNFGNEDYAFIWSQFLAWNDAVEKHPGAYLLEILDQTPAVPFVAIDPLYESPTGESITLDATPTVGFPTEFTYQWCFNGFKIPANLGGTASSINIDNLQANEGTWSVSITNSEGVFEQDFEYRVYVDSDSDGLSDAFEELISETDIDKEDTDDDGLSDAEEFNTYRTNPNSPDSDSDGFTDLYELETAYDPNSAESVPDALVNIMTAIEVKFNAALGATYAIEFSTDNQNWDIIEDDIVGEGGAVERLYSKQNFPTGFFRVERRDQ